MKLSEIKQNVYDIVTSKKDQKKAITAESLGGLLDDMCDYATTADDITAKNISANNITAATIESNRVAVNELAGGAIYQFPSKLDLDTSSEEKLEPLKHIKSWTGFDKKDEKNFIIIDRHDSEKIGDMFNEILTEIQDSKPLNAKLFSGKPIYVPIKTSDYLVNEYNEIYSGVIEFCDFNQNDLMLSLVIATNPLEESTYYRIDIDKLDQTVLSKAGIRVLYSFDARRICRIEYDKVNIRFITFLKRKPKQ